MPQNMPAAEAAIDPALVRALLTEQFPDLAALPLTPLSHGWDNALFRLGDELLVRLPRRRLSAQLIEHEQRWLPEFAPQLPLPIPAPVRVGQPAAGFPWCWSVCRYTAGTSAAEHRGALDLGATADLLATFLARLHRPAPPGAPVSAVRGVPLAARQQLFATQLGFAGQPTDGPVDAAIDPAIDPPIDPAIDIGAIRAVWDRAVAADPWVGPPCWVHGDLHPGNLIVDRDRLVAVIDFGDLNAGDPATDLAVAWMLFADDDRQRFWRRYARDAIHPVDPALQVRAHGWALAFAVVFLAHSADHPVMHGIGVRTLAAVLGDRPR